MKLLYLNVFSPSGNKHIFIFKVTDLELLSAQQVVAKNRHTFATVDSLHLLSAGQIVLFSLDTFY